MRDKGKAVGRICLNGVCSTPGLSPLDWWVTNGPIVANGMHRYPSSFIIGGEQEPPPPVGGQITWIAQEVYRAKQCEPAGALIDAETRNLAFAALGDIKKSPTRVDGDWCWATGYGNRSLWLQVPRRGIHGEPHNLVVALARYIHVIWHRW